MKPAWGIHLRHCSISILTVLIAVVYATSGEETSARSRLQQLRKERAKKGSTEKAAPAVSDWSSEDDVRYIDAMLGEEWTALGFPVAGPCTDGEFVRRATLDLLGRVPTLDETHAFLANRSSDSRTKLIHRLLASEEHGRHLANIWADLMIPIGPDDNVRGPNQNVNPDGLKNWLEKEFNRNVSWKEIVGSLIAANGRWDENGAVNFMLARLRQNNTAEMTAFTTRLFLSVQTQCTECHDHPWNEWKQDQFHGIDAFFKGTRERRVTRTLDDGRIATDYYELEETPIAGLRDIGTYFERRNGLVVMVPPTYLDGRDLRALRRGAKAVTLGATNVPLDPLGNDAVEALFADDNPVANDSDPVYLRQVLADTITADDNPYFARSFVNRMWYLYFGHSFVKNVDDFDNGQDEPTMPDLLDRLAKDFQLHGYDVRRLEKWICTSKAYGLASKPKSRDYSEALGFFTFQLMKPMTPDQLYDSLLAVTQFHKADARQNPAERRQRFLREIQTTFGTTELQTSAPRYDGTITQALMLMNSPLLTQACSCEPGTFLHQLAMNQGMTNEEKVDAIYLSALSRKPTGPERKVIEAMFRAQSVPDTLSDVLWAVVNSAEFILNH